MAITALLAGCGKSGGPSEEQTAHQKQIERCSAGTGLSAQDELFRRACQNRNPAGPEMAEAELLSLMQKHGLKPDKVDSIHSLPEGDCRQVGLEYLQLRKRAYAQPSGSEKDATLAKAAKIYAMIAAGYCFEVTTPAKYD